MTSIEVAGSSNNNNKNNKTTTTTTRTNSKKNSSSSQKRFKTSFGVEERNMTDKTQENSLDSSVVAEQQAKELANKKKKRVVVRHDDDDDDDDDSRVNKTVDDDDDDEQEGDQKRNNNNKKSSKNNNNDDDDSAGSNSEDGSMQYLEDSIHNNGGGGGGSASGGSAGGSGGAPQPLSGIQKHIDNFNKFRYVVGGMVNNKNVQTFIVILISVNAIMMGIATFGFVQNNEKVDQAFEKTDEVFLIIFTIELAMQFIYHGWRLLLDGWLVFDLFIILMSWSFNSVQIIRAFRIFRALRLVTRIKVMKNLMLALFGVIPRMLAIFILLMLIMYIFAVMFTQLFKELYVQGYLEEDYFGQMDSTLFTLFQIMTMDSWADICRQVMDVQGFGWAWMPFIAFVVITGFIVVNLIIAVICDAISALHDDDKAKLLGMYDDTDDSTSNEDSQGSPSSQMDTQEQMETLEHQIVELSRIQEQTLQTLEHLTLQLQVHTMKKVEPDSSDDSSKR